MINPFKLGLTFALLCLLSTVSAETLTPAGTVIRNQAVVEYERNDSTNIVFRSTSNEVVIEVSEVYGITITPNGDVLSPGQSQQAVSTSPTQQVTFSYQLTFTGNVSDRATISPTFSNANSDFTPRLSDGVTGFLIYNDINQNGIVDNVDILAASWRDSDFDGILQNDEISILDLGQAYEPGDNAHILVTFYIPNNLNATEATYFGIDGASIGDMSKTDTGNIAEIIIVDDAVMTVIKSANVSTIGPGGTVTFTVLGTSTGTQPAKQLAYPVTDGILAAHYGVLVWDVIPTENVSSEPLALTGTTGSPSITGGSEAGIFIYAAPASIPSTPDYATLATWNWNTDPTALGSAPTVIGYLSEGNTTAPIIAEDLDPNEYVEFIFSVNIPAYADEQFLTNIAYATYDTVAIGDQTVQSLNTVLVEVTGNSGVVIRDTDFEGSAPPLTPSDDSVLDQQLIAAAQAGNTLTFVNRVINTGVSTDSFNISLNGTSTLPSGWTVTFLKSDGVTPLRDTGTDGIIDTGPVNPHGDDIDNPDYLIDIVVSVHIPESQADATGSPLMNLIIKATSVNNASISDTTNDRLTAVARAKLNLANWTSGSLNESVVQLTTNPGGFVDFPLIVQNTAPTDAEADTYAMSTPTLPTGWRSVFYVDTNADGALNENELTPTLTTPVIPASDHIRLIGRIFVPDSQEVDPDNNGIPDVQSITFKTTSTNNPSLFDVQNDEVVLNFENRFELRPDRHGSIEPGSIVTYLHTITNFSERDIDFYFEIDQGSANWNYSLADSISSTELTKAVDPVDSLSKYSISLAAAGQPNDTKSFILRIFAPANSAIGRVDITTINAFGVITGGPAAYLDSQPLHSVVDVTITSRSDLVLVKSVLPPEGTNVDPGDTLVYTTNFFNKGVGPVTSVTIFDAVPESTSYIRQSGSVTISDYAGSYTFEISRDGGITWTADDAGSTADATITNVRAVFDSPILSGVQGSYQFEAIVR